jgi:hypothetical protein
VNAYFACFFIVRQDLDSRIASPQPKTLEKFGLLVLVERANSLGKEIFKKINFELLSCLTKGRFGTGKPLSKNLI